MTPFRAALAEVGFPFRATAFFNNLEGAIANVTLSQTPQQIIRQRQNSDTIRATGVEIEVDSRFTNTLSASGQIVFTASHFRGSTAAPAIEDNEVPQVPNVQEAASREYNETEKARIAYNRRRVVLGAPATVKARLLALRDQFEADELMVITITGDYRTRLESYELIAGAFDLNQQA